MKRCPTCRRDYYDDSLLFCLQDGADLVYGVSPDEASTAILPGPAALATGRPLSGSSTRSQTDEEDRVAAAPSASPNALPTGGVLFQKRYLLLLALLLLVAGGYFAYRNFRSGAAEQIESIAVMPFVNESGNSNIDYLSDGMAETLINSLSQLPNLKVMSRNSVFRYKGTNADPRKIGSELNVRALVTGSVKQVGDQLIINISLDDTRDDHHIWGEQYNRKESDLISLQSEIARDVSQKLRTRLSGEDVQRVAKAYTADPEAYQLYLKGRLYWNKRTGEAIKKAIEYFTQAIEIDPGYALAYVGLAECYVVPANPQPPGEKMPKARAAAMRALELDETLAEAHTALARILAVYDWNWAGAEKEFKRAIELNPRSAGVHQWYGGYLEMLGRRDESIAERRQAVELDPLSLSVNFELGLAFYYARDYDKAIQQFQKTLELDANYPLVHAHLPAAYEQKGMYDEAITGFQKGAAFKGGTEWSFSMSGLGHVYGISGRKAEARAVLDELLQTSRQQYVPADSIALIYAGLGEKDQAFTWLQKAYEERAFKMAWLNVEPQWDSLRSDPRFKELVRKVGLPQ